MCELKMGSGITIELVVLTKSSKHKGYCVAGIECNTGKWIRLVSADKETDGALTDEDCTYENGSQMEVLDVISVIISCHYPTPKQPENFLIDRNYYIEKMGKYGIAQVYGLFLKNTCRFILGNAKEYLMDADFPIDHSLELVLVTDFVTEYRTNRTGQRKLKADFNYRGVRYTNISVTDPDLYNNSCKLESAILVLSVANRPVESGKYYKFLAKCFPFKTEDEKLSYNDLDFSEKASARVFFEKYGNRLPGPLVLVKVSGNTPWYGDYCLVAERIDDYGNVQGTTYKNGIPHKSNVRYSENTVFELYQGDYFERILDYYR